MPYKNPGIGDPSPISVTQFPWVEPTFGEGPLHYSSNPDETLHLRCASGISIPLIYGVQKVAPNIIYFGEVELSQTFPELVASAWMAYCYGKAIPLYWASKNTLGAAFDHTLFGVHFNDGAEALAPVYVANYSFLQLAADNLYLPGVVHLWVTGSDMIAGWIPIPSFNAVFGNVKCDSPIEGLQLILQKDLSAGSVLHSSIEYTPGCDWPFAAPFVNIFGSNPAAAIYDMLTNEQYGLAIPAAQLDLSSFNSAAVTLAALYYGINLTIAAATSAREVIALILSTSGSLLRIGIDGRIQMVVVQASDANSPIVTLTDEDVDLSVSRQTYHDTYNEFIASFTDPTNVGFTTETITLLNDASVLTSGKKNQLRVDFGLFTNKDVAIQRLTEVARIYSYPKILGSMITSRAFYDLLPGDVVHITSSEQVIDAPFRILDKSFPGNDSNLIRYSIEEIPFYSLDKNTNAAVTNDSIPLIIGSPDTEVLTFPAFTNTSTSFSAPFVDPTRVRVKWSDAQEQKGELDYLTDFTVLVDKIVLDPAKFAEDITANALGLLSIDVWEY